MVAVVKSKCGLLCFLLFDVNTSKTHSRPHLLYYSSPGRPGDDAASSTSESARVESAKRMITDRMSRSAAGSRVKRIIAHLRADEILRPATSNHLHVTGYMQFYSPARLPTVKACWQETDEPVSLT